MTWTVTFEDAKESGSDRSNDKIHVRAIIDIDNEQAELKDLIASLQKHVKEEK